MRPIAVLLALATAIPAADAVFTIGGTLREDAIRIGANIEVDRPSPWSQVHPMTNQWSATPNIEPMIVRYRGVATGGSATELVHDAKKGSNPGAGGWQRYRDGFFNGATITIYRHEDGRARVLRTAKVRASYGGEEGQRNAFELDGAGPEIRAGDAYMVMQELDAIAPGSYRLIDDDEARSGMIAGWGPEKKQTLKLALDRTTVPPGGGRASLRIAARPGVGIGGNMHGTTWDGGKRPLGRRFNTGKGYTFSVWLRQEGMGKGTVTLRAGSLGSATVTVGREWQEHILRFQGGPPTQPLERLEVVPGEAGTLWLDKPLVTEDGIEPFAFYPQVVEQLAAAKPGTIRIWALQENTAPALPLGEALKGPFERPLVLEDEHGTPPADDLHRMLDLCVRTGAEPWIIVPTFATPDEWRQLAEYLCGPATSPMGALRAARGRQAPWSDQFKRITLDCGNETWNRMFAVQSFLGRAPAYGEYAELVYGAFLDAAGSAKDRFVPVIGGWARDVTAEGFGPTAAERVPFARLTSYAAYIGGWDGEGGGVDGAAGDRWQDMAMFYRRAYHEQRTKAAAAQTADRAQRLGLPGTFALYESGPGYELPGPSKPIDQAAEAEGKSLARAITVMDMYLTGLEHGAGPQCYFLFRTGAYWSSHATWDRPHATWQAITLANSAIAPRQLAVAASGVPTMDLPEVVNQKPGRPDPKHPDKVPKPKMERFPAVPGVPLVSCYAWQNGQELRVALLNRSTTAAQAVRIALPAAAAGAVQAQVLTGRPDAHNISTQQLAPAAWTVRLDGTAVVGDLPACSLAVVRVQLAP